MRSSNKLILDVSDSLSCATGSFKELKAKAGGTLEEMKYIKDDADSILNKSVIDDTNRLQGVSKMPSL